MRFFRNKRGLGAPVGNLIILTAAVLLSTTVVLFASNVTANQVQKESLYISQVDLSINNGTITIINTGPTSIMVKQMVIKGETFSNYTSNPDIGVNGLAKGGNATLTFTNGGTNGGILTINDIGRPVTIVISTTQASYFIETLVQAGSAGE
jgi:hypothetical protein